MQATRRRALSASINSDAVAREPEWHFRLRRLDFQPRVGYRLMSNWLRMAMRFVFRDHGTRAVKAQIVRSIMAALDAAGLTVPAASYAIVAVPAIGLTGTPWAGRPYRHDRHGRTDSERGNVPTT